ncbi:MAG: zinc-ribbon domain-containing protein [Bacillota bacterium]|nr:zinc-ribbon domain-containing protein [Bacillota bacterium]
MKCTNCGKPLREGAGFCSSCGQAVVQAIFCRKCGVELETDDKFCYACGAEVKAQPKKEAAEPPTPRRGRPAKKKASVNLDASGLYGRQKRVSISDRAIVYSNSGNLRRIDKEMNMVSKSLYAYGLAQTAEHVLALDADYNRETEEWELRLMTMDESLNVLSNAFICALPGMEETECYNFALDEAYIYLCRWTPIDNPEYNCAQDILFTRINIATGEESVWNADPVEVDGGRLVDIDNSEFNVMMVHEGKLYFSGVMHFSAEDEEDFSCVDTIDAILDFDTETCTLLWRGSRYGDGYGMPRFFDFRRGIMWTNPREMEMKRRGWEKTYHSALRDSMLPLVPRKIAYNAPILANYSICSAFPIRSNSFEYFDGEKGYAAPDYYHFYALCDGSVSEDWNGTNHGRSETAVVWQDKVIADLAADYYYTVYPAVSYKPEYDDCYRVNEI